MNRLKQHLNDSLQELEMTPALQAEIFMKTEKPAARKHSRVAAAVLLAVCMVSATAVAAAIGSGLLIRWEGEKLIASANQLTHRQLPKKAMKLIEQCIETKERQIYFDTPEQFSDAFGFDLLTVEDLQLEASSVSGRNIYTNVGGLHAETAQITARYHGRIYAESGQQTAHVAFDLCLDMDEDPRELFHGYIFQSEDDSEAPGQEPVTTTYFIPSLGVTADVVSWPDDLFLGIEAFFIYEDVTYNVSVDVPTNLLSTHESMLADCYAILDTLHD